MLAGIHQNLPTTGVIEVIRRALSASRTPPNAIQAGSGLWVPGNRAEALLSQRSVKETSPWPSRQDQVLGTR